jgi:hypothetical protein
MTESGSLPTYSYGETVRLPLDLRDATGVGLCYAMFRREKDDDTASSRGEERAELSGDGRGQTEVTVVLQATLTSQPPGIYACTHIQTRDTAGNIEEHRLDQPLRFRVADTEGADYHAPEITGIGELGR